MGTLAVSAILTRTAAAIVAISPTVWRESTSAHDQFLIEPKGSIADSFSVFSPETNTHPRPERRQIADTISLLTKMNVKWAKNQRGDGAVVDGNTALDGEGDIITAVLSMSKVDLHVVFVRAQRSTLTNGLVTGTVFFDITHRL